MKAAILSIGDEINNGYIVDTNAAWIATQLAERGITLAFHLTLPDDQNVIRESLRAVTTQVEVLVVTGGLGPTRDDLTRFALAEALGEELEEDEEGLAHMKRWYDKRGRTLSESNRVQILRPKSATLIANSRGTAPGMDVSIGQCRCFFMPGVPPEMKAMWETHVCEAIMARADGELHEVHAVSVHIVGVSESRVGELLSDLMERGRNPMVGSYPNDAVVSCRVRGIGSGEELDDLVEMAASTIEERLGQHVFGRDEETLDSSIIKRLERMGKTLVTAESCTGGWLGKLLTDAAGSSSAYLGGWVTYSNEMKIDCVNVDAETIKHHGAVSGLIADQMALGALENSGADFALATTGVAGPDGGSDEKPVGSVYIALAEIDEDGKPTTFVKRFFFPGSRDMIRRRTAVTALSMLHLFLAGEGVLPAPMLWEYQARVTAEA